MRKDPRETRVFYSHVCLPVERHRNEARNSIKRSKKEKKDGRLKKTRLPSYAKIRGDTARNKNRVRRKAEKNSYACRVCLFSCAKCRVAFNRQSDRSSTDIALAKERCLRHFRVPLSRSDYPFLLANIFSFIRNFIRIVKYI